MLQINRKLSIFAESNNKRENMKSSELHRLIRRNGWRVLRQQGTSHIIYEKDGKTYSAPFHGSKEVPTGTEKAIKKEMGLK